MRSEQLVHPSMVRVVEVAPIPEQSKAATGTKDAPDLRHGFVGSEPVEGLAARDRVDTPVRERDRLRRAGERLDTRYGTLELGAHSVDRLDGDDAGTEGQELPRELAGARREIEHVAARADAEPLRDPRNRLVRISRSRPLVDLRGGREAGLRRRMNPRHWGVMR